MSLDNVILHERSDMASSSWIPENGSYVLTSQGWRPIWAIKEGDVLMTNSFDGVLKFNEVLSIKKDIQNLVETSHSFWKFTTGYNHKWVGYRRMALSKGERLHVYDHKPCIKTTKEFHILNCGVFEGGVSDITEDDCSLLGWLLADGYVKWSPVSYAPSTSHGTKRGVIALITQNDNKYGSEIKELLIRIGAYGSESVRKNTINVCRDYTLQPAWFRSYWKRLGFEELDKHSINLVSFLIKQPLNNVKAFMDGFFKADGHITRKGCGSKVITQNQNNLSEGVIVGGYLLGYNISSGIKDGYYINNRSEVNLCKWYKLGEKRHQTTMRTKTKVLPEDTVIQLEVDGYVVCRQEDTVTSL